MSLPWFHAVLGNDVEIVKSKRIQILGQTPFNREEKEEGRKK
jgi:hypothetical protein